MAGSRVGGVRAAVAGLLLSAALAGDGGAQALEPPATRGQRLQQLGAVIQRRLGLSDEQGRRLRTVSARYARERQAVVAREREARLTLRDEVPRGGGADQARVRQALDALVAAQQRRAGLLADEQRELAAFLTPTQRAQYLGLQERALRAAQRVRGQRDSAGPFGDERPFADRRLRRPRL